jgi:hypothetical protein
MEVANMEAMKNLLERRSIRKYKDTQVPDELLDQVLDEQLPNERSALLDAASKIRERQHPGT